MTPQSVDASPHEAKEWHDIDWRAVNRFVRRLQARIVKAVKEGKWRDAKNLQRLLSHSWHARALAVKRVTENKGRRTPGVDGELWKSVVQKRNAISRLSKKGYKPRPLRRIYIPKKNGKKRPLSIPTMLDRAQQALHLQTLEPVAETMADPHSFGFRRERSTADAIAQCYLILGRKHSAKWVLEGDIKGCFDHISHEWLEGHIPMDRDMLRKWLKCGYMEENKLFPAAEGTPQGGIASPVLANMTLDGLERKLRQRYPLELRYTGFNPKVNYVRYADDFIVTASSRELLEDEIKPMIRGFLSERGLSLSEEKTRITHVDEGFNFLGFHIQREGGRLRVTPTDSNIKKLKEGVKELIDEHRGRAAAELIVALNQKLGGWGHYYRHVSSANAYIAIDHYTFGRLWDWVKRSHPGKPVRWRKQRYFPATERVSWNFSDRDQKGRMRRLLALVTLGYRRHYQVKAEANPFDPEWDAYFEERAWQKARRTGAARHVWLLMNRQKGICPFCRQTLDVAQTWRIHQTQSQPPEQAAGTENSILLHQECLFQLRWRQKHGKPEFTAGSPIAGGL